MTSQKIIVFTWSLLLLLNVQSQSQQDYSTGEIIQQLEKLNTLGSALYVAAHPDDENTQLIAYLANGMHIRTGYLAATRGDGGQNLIGPEIREKLGIIRTQELLAARKIDGGHQFFSRANDFGYSKDPQETFNVWDKEKVLADFVWAIRKFRPDVLIARFNTEPGTTHGHHTASAILAKKAFELSGDPSVFPEQLKYVQVWEPKKILWNTSPWFFRRTGQEFNEEDYIKVNVGAYNPYLGTSYTEISARSRSMHKSQGFGATGTRGENYEYFKHWGGIQSEDLFGGIDLTWERIDGAERVSYFLKEAQLNFDPMAPYSILPELLGARKELLGLRDQYWKEVKLDQIEEAIRMITGTYMEVTADDFLYTRGDSIKLNLELINRSPVKMKLSGVSYSLWDDRVLYKLDLEENQKITFSSALRLPDQLAVTHPYWLEKPGSEGMYAVEDQQLIGLPEDLPLLTAQITLNIEDQFIDYYLPVVYKRNDPVKGETSRPLELSPKVMVSLENTSLVFGDESGKEVTVRVTAGTDNLRGEVYLEVPESWQSKPQSLVFDLENKREETMLSFQLLPPSGASTGSITAIAKHGGELYRRGISTIAYDHIPTQTLFPEAKGKVVKLDLDRNGNKIGYIMGAGDDVPLSLEQVGYEVTLLEKDDVVAGLIHQYDAIILGIRAFNTVPWLAYKNQTLFDYVEKGGNLIVQYNTSHRLITEEIAPYQLGLSRDRVTVEEAPVTFLTPKHPVLNRPNKISKDDFDGWVQERGLYFPDSWSKEFTPVLSISDPGEDAKFGSLLVARYGKGYYIYTGLSFFRELPAGVPGAYRLLINMLSLGKNNQPK